MYRWTTAHMYLHGYRTEVDISPDFNGLNNTPNCSESFGRQTQRPLLAGPLLCNTILKHSSSYGASVGCYSASFSDLLETLIMVRPPLPWRDNNCDTIVVVTLSQKKTYKKTTPSFSAVCNVRLFISGLDEKLFFMKKIPSGWDITKQQSRIDTPLRFAGLCSLRRSEYLEEVKHEAMPPTSIDKVLLSNSEILNSKRSKPMIAFFAFLYLAVISTVDRCFQQTPFLAKNLLETILLLANDSFIVRHCQSSSLYDVNKKRK